jgi:uncharacterized cupin superfamily protein
MKWEACVASRSAPWRTLRRAFHHRVGASPGPVRRALQAPHGARRTLLLGQRLSECRVKCVDMASGEHPNIFSPHWDADRDEPPFRWRRARIGRQAGARALGASVFELPPGGATFQLHAHHANEELIIVLAGRLRLTTSVGEQELDGGDVVSCPAGRGGVHRLDNCGDQAARVLIASTMVAPDVTELFEDGQLWMRDYPPGGEPGRDALDVKLPFE